MRRSLVLALVCSCLAGPASAAKPQIQWDSEFDFTQVRTFMWRDSAGQSLVQNDPFLHQHIINSIEYQLTANGLREVESDPDVIVTYYGSTETNVSLQSDSYGYGFGGYGMGRWGYYGYGMGGPTSVSTTTRVHTYERGTLVVDIVDAEDDALIWRGSVSDITVSDDARKMQKYVDKAIKRMAKQANKLRESGS